MFSLCEILPRPLPLIHVVDVGAMALEGVAPPYDPLVRAGAARVTGFEPVEEECRKLNAACPPGHTFLPYAVGDGTVRTFRECNFSMTSSLYEPNTALLDRFQNLGELTRVVSQFPMETRRLDDLAEVRDADFLKLDVQGAERDVIEGAASVLGHTLAVHTEVEFVPLYAGQPLFAEVDQALRRNGFCFHRFAGLAGRTFKPLVYQNNPNAMLSQALWADAVYVRDWMHWEALVPEELLKLALILHDVYSSCDLALAALAQYDRKNGGALSDAYLKRLTGNAAGRPPVPQETASLSR
ncbi:MAG TPA: FkbM family methyltransferase [Bryobacteraceae bacterium]|nr:FkbM family methyltransferase [Bryobacteraceae bacterium]